MFTGLVTDVGRIAAREDRSGVRRLTVESAYPVSALNLGASVMHAGVCLTLVEFGARPGGGSWWIVEAVPETLARTVLGAWDVDARVNLELSLRLGDELGGHLVAGHVDGLARTLAVTPEGASWRIRFGMPSALAKFIAEKGSVSVDGVSLTVAGVGSDQDGEWFEAAIIPHTLEATTLGRLNVGAMVNLEIDLLARYVARMIEVRDR